MHRDKAGRLTLTKLVEGSSQLQSTAQLTCMPAPPHAASRLH